MCLTVLSPLSLQQRSLGKALFDLVCAHLNLVEGDYFGLEYQDHRKMTVSLHLRELCHRDIRNLLSAPPTPHPHLFLF